MADMTTIARPYAKAAFEHALAQSDLAGWSNALHLLAETILTPAAEAFISEPSVTEAQKIELLLTPLNKTGELKDQSSLENFLKLLADNKRLQILPDIYVQFQTLRSDHEKTLTVDVRSYAPLSDAQQNKLTDMLKKRLQRDISLDIQIDESLLGGAIITAGDLVIDGSVRGKLNKLQTNLAA